MNILVEIENNQNLDQIPALLDPIENPPIFPVVNNLNINNMANPNYTLLRFQADNIPHFDGNPKLLQRFICSCENLLRAFQNRAQPDDPINLYLLDTILGKLTSRAAELIASRAELNSWQTIKDALNTIFSDQRSIDCLIQDLIMLKPLKNETPINFGMRIQDARSLLFSKLNATNEDRQVKLIKIQHYDDFALKTFINGLPYNMQLIIRLKQPDSLETAMANVREEENFIYFKNQNSNFGNVNNYQRNTKPTTVTKPIYNPTNYRPNFTQIPTPNIFPRPVLNFPNNNYRPNWSFPQNNNFRPFFTNNFRPNFTPQNRPNNQNNQQIRPANFQSNFNRNPTQRTNLTNNRPTPMDTSSGNTVLNNSNNPKFTFQELYNQEISELDPSSSNNYQSIEPTEQVPNEQPEYNEYSYQFDPNDPYNPYNNYYNEDYSNQVQDYQINESFNVQYDDPNATQFNQELNFHQSTPPDKPK